MEAARRIRRITALQRCAETFHQLLVRVSHWLCGSRGAPDEA
jgi:hypothetical protein